MIKEKLRVIRRDALNIVQETLAKKGFSRENERVWKGPLDVDSHNLEISVELFPDFPDSLPVIKVIDISKLPPPLAHLEQEENGLAKICIGLPEGVLLDSLRPGAIVSDSLKIAKNTIQDSLNKRNLSDIPEEFLLYWKGDLKYQSILDIQGPSRPICFFELEPKNNDSKLLPGLLAETKHSALNWAKKLGIKVGPSFNSFYFPLDNPLFLPLTEDYLVEDILEILKNHSTEENYYLFKSFRAEPPLFLAVSFPGNSPNSEVLFGIFFKTPSSKELRKRSIAGFRRNKVSLGHQLGFLGKEKVKKVKFDRYDAGYLLLRGSGLMEIRDKTVLVAGCGAVGSRIADKMVSAGLGKVILVDPDNFKNDNLQRHILPVAYSGTNKAEALGDFFQKKFPHCSFEVHNSKILDFLNEKEDILKNLDLVVMATGDETVEIRVNELLWSHVPCTFSWVEPLGLGGHVVTAGINKKPGCLYCLYQNKNNLLTNMASFTEPNQNLRRNHAGCGGTFLPFSALDADRTALEATSLIINTLLKKEKQNILISWFGDSSAFKNEGFVLSEREKLFSQGELKRETEYVNINCPICSRTRDEAQAS